MNKKFTLLDETKTVITTTNTMQTILNGRSIKEVKKINLLDAYKAGYEQRVCDQLTAALNGEGQSSGFNQKALDAKAEVWVSKHFCSEIIKKK